MNGKSNLTNFLNDLTDQELSVFIKYQYASFLFGSKEKIDLEVQKRGLSEAEIEKIGKVKLNEDSGENINICNRCGSEHFFIETDIEEVSTRKYYSENVEVHSSRCRICGYNSEKSETKNFIQKIKNIFGME